LGQDFLNSGTAGMLVLAGVEFSRENSSLSGQANKNGAEGLVQLQFSKSVFRTLQFNGQIAAYPGLTIPGKVQFSIQSSLRREIVRNLYVKVSIYANYDSDPPSREAESASGPSTSRGWKF
jgi:hypothetical protein